MLCKHCGAQVYQDERDTFIDNSGGDVCGWNGGNEPHEPEWKPEPRCYRIIRFHENGRPRTVRNNVTLTEAQAHCSREDTHGTRGGRRWFDGYDYMRGCRPREER